MCQFGVMGAHTLLGEAGEPWVGVLRVGGGLVLQWQGGDLGWWLPWHWVGQGASWGWVSGGRVVLREGVRVVVSCVVFVLLWQAGSAVLLRLCVGRAADSGYVVLLRLCVVGAGGSGSRNGAVGVCGASEVVCSESRWLWFCGASEIGCGESRWGSGCLWCLGGGVW